MYANLKRSIEEVLKHEGGFVNHPKDPGGATNLGVTLANFRRYVKPGGTVEDLKRLTVAQAETVYERQYWDAVRGSALPSGVDFAVFDFGVNSGPKRAIQFLQRQLGGTSVDGVIGPKTLGAVEYVVRVGSARALINQLCDARLAYLKRLKTWPTFGKGWSRRVEGVRQVALSMAS